MSNTNSEQLVDSTFWAAASADRTRLEAEIADLKRKVEAGSEFSELYSLQLIRVVDELRRFETVTSYVGETGVGAVLKNESREQFAVLLPDASHQGMYRYQMFDPNGFFSHKTEASLYDAAFQATLEGYCIPDRLGEGLRLMQTQAFDRGNRIAGLIQRINEGTLAFSAFSAAVGDIDEDMNSEMRFG